MCESYAFALDGNEIIEEYNSSNTLQADYVMGSRIDEPLTMTRSSTTYYYNTDGLGSVRQVLNSSGTIVESYDYDPYGGTTIYNSSLTDITSSGSGIDNPYMYTGRRFDEETDIYHYRARQYDPEIGRFLQRDPLGYYDSMNLYEYVGSNPVNAVDPLGLFGSPLPVPGSGPWPLPGVPELPTGSPSIPFPMYPGPNQPTMCDGTVPIGMDDPPTPAYEENTDWPWFPLYDISECYKDPTLPNCKCEFGWSFDCDTPPERIEPLRRPAIEGEDLYIDIDVYETPVGPLFTPAPSPTLIQYYLIKNRKRNRWRPGFL